MHMTHALVGRLGLAGCVAALLVAACTTTPPAAAPTAVRTPQASSSRPTTLEQIAHYTGPDRQQILEEGAKQEGTVQLYTSGILEGAEGEIIKNFEARYGISV